MVAEYTLRGMTKPIGVSEYELTRTLPEELKSALPTIEEIEAGADKIARAAVRALWVIDDLREHTGNPLPLLWEPGVPHESGIIEVYHAATLKAHGLSDRGYKGSKVEHRDARKVLITCLSKILKFDLDTELMAASDDALDAAICVLAAADFANCSVHLQPDEMFAKKEGWIWFHKTLPIQ